MKTILTNTPLSLLILCCFVFNTNAQNLGEQFDPCSGATDLIPNIQTLTQHIQTTNAKPTPFDCECTTDFFTVDTNGAIQQWTLSNNTVTGGNTLLTTGHRGGLAYCGSETSRTFYCANYPGSSFRYYDTLGGNWINVTTPFTQALNNGGYKQHQYYMSGTGSLKYYNGYSFKNVPVPTPFQMTVYDIAVDTLGQAWVFTGPSFGSTTQLRVFDSTGLKTSFNFTFNTIGTYGTLFIDNQLYLARGTQGDLVPLFINGSTVTTGTSIAFPNIANYADVASCYCITPPPPPPCPDLTPVTFILPGNVSGMSALQVAVRIAEVNNAPTDGQPITVRMPSDPRMLFVWDIGLTQAAFIPVQNANWNYLGDNGIVNTWTYNGPGLIIPGGTTSAFGFNAFYDPQATSGFTSITATVVPFSGGECTITNNADAEKLIYFQ